MQVCEYLFIMFNSFVLGFNLKVSCGIVEVCVAFFVDTGTKGLSIVLF